MSVILHNSQSVMLLTTALLLLPLYRVYTEEPFFWEASAVRHGVVVKGSGSAGTPGVLSSPDVFSRPSFYLACPVLRPRRFVVLDCQPGFFFFFNSLPSGCLSGRNS